MGARTARVRASTSRRARSRSAPTVGGPAADALDGLASSLRDRLSVVAEARALSAQARYSAWVIGLAPIGYLVSTAAGRPAVGPRARRHRRRSRVRGAGLGLELLGALLDARDRAGRRRRVIALARARVRRRCGAARSSHLARREPVSAECGPWPPRVRRRAASRRRRRARASAPVRAGHRDDRPRRGRAANAAPEAATRRSDPCASCPVVGRPRRCCGRRRLHAVPRGRARIAVRTEPDRGRAARCLASLCARPVVRRRAARSRARRSPTLRPLADALRTSARLGTPAAPALARLATEVRADVRRRAEARARTVPVRLCFPLVLCVLPAFALLTVVPVVLSGLRTLSLRLPRASPSLPRPESEVLAHLT